MSTFLRAAGKRLRGLLLVLGCFLIFASAASRGVAAPSATDLRAVVFLAATTSGRRTPRRWARAIFALVENECSRASPAFPRQRTIPQERTNGIATDQARERT
jgi:hypothetical protein